MKKLSKAQERYLNEMINEIKKARTLDYITWSVAKNRIYEGMVEGDEKYNLTIERGYLKDYEWNRSGRVLTFAPGRTLEILEAAGYLTIEYQDGEIGDRRHAIAHVRVNEDVLK